MVGPVREITELARALTLHRRVGRAHDKGHWVPAAAMTSTEGLTMKGKPYAALGTAIAVHFFIMWALTYVGVAALDQVFSGRAARASTSTSSN